MKKWTTTAIRDAKGRQKIACLTAGDYAVARMLDAAGIQLILVGDSLGMTMLGYETTLPVTMDDMLRHTAAVVRGADSALVVADMPFMSYQLSPAQALENAGRFLKEAGADAVKLEGGRNRVDTVRLLVENGIPVMGHIGLMPQSVRQTGGYKMQGKSTQQAADLRRDAQLLADAGVFALVLECVPPELAAEITETVSIPTVGIGAGAGCDGQILVANDMLGLNDGQVPSFVKRYADLGREMRQAFEAYRNEVQTGTFPAAN